MARKRTSKKAASVTGETSSIARGTRVKTPDGWTPIERLEAGDAVVAWDHEALEYVETVVAATNKTKKDVVAVAVENMRLRVTVDHSVWSPEESEYRPVEEWLNGELSELLRTTRGTQIVEITDRLAYDGKAEVHNITVEHDLANFVADGFVVHHQPPVVAN